MVMASASLHRRRSALDLAHEGGDARDEAAAAAALHDRLVAYVHALSGGPEPRSGVWVEHSYARARGAAAAAAAQPRVLLAPRAPPAPAEPDVERLDPEPAEPDDGDAEDEGDAAGDSVGDEPEEDREARVTALAPSAAHARLAEGVVDTLRRMRLARLAGGRGARAETARAAARRLRLALAAAAPARPRAAPWLHAALLSHLPRSSRALYDEAVAELLRTAPRLAERLTGVRARASPHVGAGVGPAVPSAAPVWLVWVGGGRPGLEERWARRLGALVHVRRAAAGGAGGPPEAWCAAAAAGARAALADALVEAGERTVIAGGVGAGAALCATLAGRGGARVRGLLLLAPPLLTAEGPRDAPDDPLAEVGVPVLVVAGTAAAACWRGAARDAGGGAGGGRRVLEVRGADDALRVPGAVRARLRLPQHALDAAVAEECARWIAETAESDEAPAPALERREREWERPRRRGAEPEDEEYAHLPAAARVPAPAPAPAPAAAPGSDRSIEIVEGRVVSRGSGGVPLALLPPRRSPAALAAADIMHLPIVFADDEPAAAEPGAPASPVTVTSGEGGAARYTRVIVAKRGAGGAGAARPVLLRRGLRLVPRDHDP